MCASRRKVTVRANRNRCILTRGSRKTAPTMKPISRRAFLAASASAVAAPALAATRQPPAMLDAVIVGAGAAGIAAGRRLAAAKKRFLIVEATDRIGGRCFTETQTFGVPYDRGAHWINAPDVNAVAKLAPSIGITIER